MSSDRRTPRIAWARALLVLTVAVLFQVTLLDRLDPAGVVRFDLPLLFVVAVALRSGADDAALLGFAAGLGVDLFHVGPFGQHSLVYCLLGLAVAAASRRLDGPRRAGGLAALAGLGTDTARRAARRALLAGTATVAAGFGLLVVRAAAEPTIPPLDAIVVSQPLGGLTGSIIGINLVAASIRGLRLVAEPDRSVVARWLPLARDRHVAGSLPTVRRP